MFQNKIQFIRLTCLMYMQPINSVIQFNGFKQNHKFFIYKNDGIEL